MKGTTWRPYARFVLLTEGVGALSGFLTRRATEVYRSTVAQPPLSPPPIVFPIVWGILFFLLGIGAARVYCAPPSRARTQGLRLFALQLSFNFFWSLIFFGLRAFGFAFLWLLALWAQIYLMIRAFRRVDPPAAWLQAPYFLWVAFAGYLNFGVWLLNR